MVEGCEVRGFGQILVRWVKETLQKGSGPERAKMNSRRVLGLGESCKLELGACEIGLGAQMFLVV